MSTEETRNIVILGGSFAGQSTAHYIYRHIYPALKTTSNKYNVHLVDPSSHFWWRISAPRALVDAGRVPHNKTFIPIADGFKQYPDSTETLKFHQAEATAVDTTARTVTIRSTAAGANGDVTTLPYYALVIATGTRTPTALTSLQGSHETSVAALDEMNKRLASPSVKEIVISGGGPVAVETAGEIGEKLNGKLPKLDARKVKITVVTGSDKLLPVLRKQLSEKAEKMLNKFGVEVMYNTKVSKIDLRQAGEAATGENGAATTPADAAGKTIITLDNGKELSADIYIPATGVKPNTTFLPSSMLDTNGYVTTSGATLRVDNVGPRVYCIGDAGNYSRGGVMDMYAALPVMATNLKQDLLADGTAADEKAKAPVPAGKVYKEDKSETQLVPVGGNGGVAAVKGIKMPGMMVKMIKGKDYMIKMIPNITEGKQWKKP